MRFFLLLFLTFITFNSFAEECEHGSYEQMNKNKSCSCTSVLPAKIVYPKYAEFLHVCNFERYPEEVWGDFFYKTNIVLSGRVRFEPAELGRGDLYFFSNTGEKNSTPHSLGHDSFYNSGSAILKLKVPKKVTASCMTAPATIKVNSYLSVLDGGTDGMGTYIQDFTVIKIGKYRNCNPSESGTDGEVFEY